MQFLIEMALADAGRPTTVPEGQAFIEQLVFPTLERCLRLVEEGKIVAGGPMSGRIAIAMVVEAGSAREIDVLLGSLPLWPRMNTTVLPLSSFADRRWALAPRLDELRGGGREVTP